MLSTLSHTYVDLDLLIAQVADMFFLVTLSMQFIFLGNQVVFFFLGETGGAILGGGGGFT